MNQKTEQIDKMFRIIESCETSLQIINVEKFILVADFVDDEERKHFLFFIDTRKRRIQEREDKEKLNKG